MVYVAIEALIDMILHSVVNNAHDIPKEAPVELCHEDSSNVIECVTQLIEAVIDSVFNGVKAMICDTTVSSQRDEFVFASCSSSTLVSSSQDSFLSVSFECLENTETADHIITRKLLKEAETRPQTEAADDVKCRKSNIHTDCISREIHQRRCLIALFLESDPFHMDLYEFLHTYSCSMESLMYQPRTSRKFLMITELEMDVNLLQKSFESSSSRMIKSSEQSNVPGRHNILVQDCIFRLESLVMSLEMDQKLCVVPMDLADSPTTPHIILGPTIGVFLVWSQVIDGGLENVSELCIRSRNSFDQIWMICVGDYSSYIQSVRMSQAASGSNDQIMIMTLFVTDEEQLAATIADLSESVGQVVDKLQDVHTNHEHFLMSAFPSLNIYAARLILSDLTLLEFLSLTEPQLLSRFPWLSLSRVKHIVANASFMF